MVHLYDLFCVGNLWASTLGISTKEVLARIGQDDMRAAMIQRGTYPVERRIADDLSRMAQEYRDGRGDRYWHVCGTGVRPGCGASGTHAA